MLRSIERLDDAGVYKISDDVAIIQTVDFITPIVNDPYSFGQIAAANSISDIYTMGGKPITAMNVVCFPSSTMDILILREILRGGLDKMQEAGVALMGGHSVTDPEMKYGLSVTGVVHPDKLITNSGTRNRRLPGPDQNSGHRDHEHSPEKPYRWMTLSLNPSFAV